MFNKINDVITYIENNRGSHLSLDRINAALKELDDPHLKYPTIHIAGTNGKGSTTNYLRAILQNAGLKVGSYTSPYLEAFNDRIRINNEWISDEDLIYYTNNYYYLFEKHQLTFFEILTIIAFIYFAHKKVDIAVIEVGLGGRLDATNVIQPICSAITNISFDHMAELGNTLELIAAEKGGIIKQKTPIFTTIEQSNALNVIKEICTSKNAPLTIVNPYQEINYDIKTNAKYQIKNINLVLNITKFLILKGYPITDDHIKKALKETNWSGRFEKINDNPTIIIDGAHNIGGIQALKESIENIYESNKVHILFTALRDKECKEMIDILNTITPNIYLTTFDFYRASSLDELTKQKHRYAFKDYQEAIYNISSTLNKDEVLIVTGSLYFLSEVRKHVLNKYSKNHI